MFRYETPAHEVVDYKGPVVFLAGPTVRGHQPHLTSWRPECIEMFEREGFEGALVVPEFSVRSMSDKGKPWIPRWEFSGLKRADCVLFWVPRTRELIGLTTNHEHGYWLGRMREKMVYGRPDDAYRVDYLDIMWQIDAEDRGVSAEATHSNMMDLVIAACKMAKSRFNSG